MDADTRPYAAFADALKKAMEEIGWSADTAESHTNTPASSVKNWLGGSVCPTVASWKIFKGALDEERKKQNLSFLELERPDRKRAKKPQAPLGFGPRKTADSYLSASSSNTPSEELMLLREKLGLRPGPEFLALTNLAADLQHKITIGMDTIEFPLVDYEGIPSSSIAFNDIGELVLPAHVARIVPEVERRIREKGEENRPKLFVTQCDPPIDDKGDKLYLDCARGKWHHTRAIEDTATDTRNALIIWGAKASIPTKINIVATIVSRDNKFLLGRRNRGLHDYSEQWGLPGEHFCPDRDSVGGRIDAMRTAMRFFTDHDEAKLTKLKSIQDRIEVTFVALSNNWRCFTRELFAVIRVPIDSQDILGEIRGRATEHSLVVMYPFKPDAVFTLLSQTHFSAPGVPNSTGEIADYSKAGLLAALFHRYRHQEVIEQLRAW